MPGLYVRRLRNFLKWCRSGTYVKVGLPAILLPLLNRGGLELWDRRQQSFTLRLE